MIDRPCIICGKSLTKRQTDCCSRQCGYEKMHRVYIEDWKAGKKTGLTMNGTVTGPIKVFLRRKYSDKCCLCGWSEINPHTGKVPLVADHIDGNWKNNTEENLRLVCPNCDSLSSTYGGLNRGNGRGYLKVVKLKP